MGLNRITVKFWRQDHTFTPAIVHQQWGDGLQYVALSPILTRPLFFVIRIDSKMDLSNDEFRDLLDEEIYEAIEREFGDCCEAYSETGSCGCDHYEAFPAMYEWGGSTWRELGAGELHEIGIKLKTKVKGKPRACKALAAR